MTAQVSSGTRRRSKAPGGTLRIRVPSWLTGRRAIALPVALATFLFRFLIPDFENDHFMHLSWGRQMLLGEVPVWDFVEPGFILQTGLSAVFQAVGGHQLLGEAILTAGALAIAAALVYLVAFEASASVLIALLCSGLSVAVFPRLYGYPKVLVYPMAMLAFWHYVDAPSQRRLRLLSLATAAAFLFRHDHGVYVAGVVGSGLLLRQWGLRPREEARTAVRSYVVQVAALCLPYALFVVSSGQTASYVRFLTNNSTAVATGSARAAPGFTYDRSAPVWRLADPVGYPVHVEWHPDVDAATRGALEERYSLQAPTLLEDGRAWSYQLFDDSPDNLRTLAGDPVVVDTHGFDRSTYEITFDLFRSVPVTAARALPLLRIRPLPGFFTEANATVWLAWLFWAVPLGAAVIWTRATYRSGLDPAAVKSAVLIAMSLLVSATLVRGSYDSRIPDAAAPVAVAGAWLAARGLTGDIHPGRRRVTRALSRIGRAGAVSILLAVTSWAVVVYGQLPVRLAQAGLSQPLRLLERAGEVVTQLKMRPLDAWAPEGSVGLRQAARYVNRCTAPETRLQVLGFEPQMYYYAERGFAGGQSFFHSRWHDSMDDQRRALTRWQTEDAPLLLAVARELESVRSSYPFIYAYISRRYRLAGEIPGDNRGPVTVMVDRRAPALGSYGAGDLPCFTEAGGIDRAARLSNPAQQPVVNPASHRARH